MQVKSVFLTKTEIQFPHDSIFTACSKSLLPKLKRRLLPNELHCRLRLQSLFAFLLPLMFFERFLPFSCGVDAPHTVLTLLSNYPLSYFQNKTIKLRVKFVEVFSWQASVKCNQFTDNTYAYTVSSNFYPVENFIPSQFFQVDNIMHCTYIFNAQDGFLNFIKKFSVVNFVDIFVKLFCKCGFHRNRLNDFITCSRLTYSELLLSSIIAPNIASSKSSMTS